ncbi:DUF1579 family protein [Streptomyces sp. NPDC005355]|uniref:DUF1579 family protein n=1 Tax=Streptomyces sp. NPDC005355 TaxID=3157038 RepID=UPI00339E7B04
MLRDFFKQAMPRMLVGAATMEPAKGGRVTSSSSTAAPEMRALDVLLGNWRCDSVVYPSGRGPDEVVLRGTLAPVLGGAWYQWNFTQDPNDIVQPPMSGRYTFGWNPATAKYVAIYYDDRGNYLLQTTPTPEWVDGHLRFQGTTTLVDEGEVQFTDDITSRGPGHFRNEVTITSHGETRLHATLECVQEEP